MSDQGIPKLTRITRYLADRIAGIKVGAGFHCELFPVRPIVGQEINRRNGTAVIIQDAARRPDDPALRMSHWVQTYTIDVYLGQSKNSDVPLDEFDAIVRADIERALLQSDADWAMGDDALDTEISDFTPSIDAATNLVVISGSVDVQYRAENWDQFGS